MNLSTLKPAKGSTKDRKRVGRGPGSGLQKTSGRGSKGQLQGAGFTHKRGFEGGQMPLVRRVPKRGFTNLFRVAYEEINLDRLAGIAKDEIGPQDMVEAGLIKNLRTSVKILGRGEIAAAKSIRAHKFSASAKAKIEAAGGRALILEV